MNAKEYKQLVDQLGYGKRLPGALYILDPGESSELIPSVLRITLAELRRRLEIGPGFNLLKLHLAAPKVSFLAYPGFDRDPHPELQASVIVDLVTGKVRRDDYSKRANPPVLHRKETFLPPGDLRRKKFERLTRQEEEAGLLEETSRIGFRLNWEKTVAAAGYRFRGHRLEKIEGQENPEPKSRTKRIARHKTAIVRRELSKPVKTLLELNQLRRDESFFDYGCGYGGDVEGISRLGHRATGWDPRAVASHQGRSPKALRERVRASSWPGSAAALLQGTLRLQRSSCPEENGDHQRAAAQARRLRNQRRPRDLKGRFRGGHRQSRAHP